MTALRKRANSFFARRIAECRNCFVVNIRPMWTTELGRCATVSGFTTFESRKGQSISKTLVSGCSRTVFPLGKFCRFRSQPCVKTSISPIGRELVGCDSVKESDFLVSYATTLGTGGGQPLSKGKKSDFVWLVKTFGSG